MNSLEAAIDRLRQRYQFRNAKSLDHFLSEHPDLVSILHDAADAIPQYFGPDATPSLELFIDPEGDGSPELFALVGTSLGADESVRRLLEFDEGWRYQSTHAQSPLLNFDVEAA